MLVQFKHAVYEAIPTGEYRAVCTGIEPAETQYGKQVKLSFEIQGGEHSGRRLIAYCSLSQSTKSKLHRWCQSLLARPIRENEQVDLNSLVNRPCTLVVLRVPKPDGSGSAFNKVEDVLPAPPPDDLFEAS